MMCILMPDTNMDPKPPRLTNNSPEILGRQRRVVELRADGLKILDIAKQMGCSPYVVNTLLSRAEDARLNFENPEWMKGLPHRSMRTLLQYGYSSKEEVAAGLASGNLSAELPGVGKKMLAALCAWLDAPLPKRVEVHKVPTKEAIARAKRTLERAGFTVLPPTHAGESIAQGR